MTQWHLHDIQISVSEYEVLRLIHIPPLICCLCHLSQQWHERTWPLSLNYLLSGPLWEKCVERTTRLREPVCQKIGDLLADQTSRVCYTVTSSLKVHSSQGVQHNYSWDFCGEVGAYIGWSWWEWRSLEVRAPVLPASKGFFHPLQTHSLFPRRLPTFCWFDYLNLAVFTLIFYLSCLVSDLLSLICGGHWAWATGSQQNCSKVF